MTDLTVLPANPDRITLLIYQFAQHCSSDEYTDTGDVWEKLHAIAEIMSEIRTILARHPNPTFFDEPIDCVEEYDSWLTELYGSIYNPHDASEDR